MADTPARPPGWPPNVKTQAEVAELSDISPDCQFLARRRVRWMAEREKGQLEAAIEAERKEHFRRAKLNAAQVRDGLCPPGFISFPCTMLCPVCHPPVEGKPVQRSDLATVDLRPNAPVRKRRRKKVCKVCGGPLRSKRFTYCGPACRYGPKDAVHLPPPRRCAFCGQPTKGRKYCNKSCECKDYRRRKARLASVAEVASAQ